jgi:hypothetical protein
MEVVEEHSLKTTLRVAGGWVRDKVILIIVEVICIDYGQREQ